VVLALRLRFRYLLSCREVSELMAEMGHPVSESTVLFWIGKFSDSFQMLQRRYRPEYSRIWHVDELHVRLRGGKGYVYVVEDDRRSVIALELSWRRDRDVIEGEAVVLEGHIRSRDRRRPSELEHTREVGYRRRDADGPSEYISTASV